MTQHDYYMHVLHGILATVGVFGLALALLVALAVLWLWIFE